MSRNTGRFICLLGAALLVSVCTISKAGAQFLNIGGATGVAPGETVWFDVTFNPQGVSVSALEHTITFDPTYAPIVECEPDPDLVKGFLADYLPFPCGGSGEPPCNQLRVLILDSLDMHTQPESLLVPQILYRCRVDVSSAAPDDSVYLMLASDVHGSAPTSDNVPTGYQHGGILVDPDGNYCCTPTCHICPPVDSGGAWPILIGLGILGIRHLRRRLSVVLLVAALLSTPPITSQADAQVCTGDCDMNREVHVHELIRGIQIALGTLPLSLIRTRRHRAARLLPVAMVVEVAISRRLRNSLSQPRT